MATRTTERQVTFSEPFRLRGFDGPQAPGTYRIVEDEEEVLGLSFLAWQRVRTAMHLPALGVASSIQEVVPVDPDELDLALARDAGRPGGDTTPGG